MTDDTKTEDKKEDDQNTATAEVKTEEAAK
jgi:hypothetical protein